jgi:hypothetical protein
MTTFDADSTELDRFTAPEKNALILIPSSIDRYAVPASFSPLAVIEAVRLSQVSIEEQVTSVYCITYIQHGISTFNTCSWVPTTTRSLSDT